MRVSTSTSLSGATTGTTTAKRWYTARGDQGAEFEVNSAVPPPPRSTATSGVRGDSAHYDDVDSAGDGRSSVDDDADVLSDDMYDQLRKHMVDHRGRPAQPLRTAFGARSSVDASGKASVAGKSTVTPLVAELQQMIRVRFAERGEACSVHACWDVQVCVCCASAHPHVSCCVLIAMNVCTHWCGTCCDTCPTRFSLLHLWSSSSFVFFICT
jgi:hypothetical protein